MFIVVSKAKVLCVAALIVLVVGSVALFFLYKEEEYGNSLHHSSSEPNTIKSSKFYRNSVVSNGPECAPIGMKILTEENGTAVDAAIATLFCEGVTICQSMGLGGGFLATMYEKKSGKIETIVARERAPLASSEKMFENMDTVTGILSVAVPGELKGYAEMHQKYGRVPWKRLIQPTIDLCRSGHIVTGYLATVLQKKRKLIFESPSLKEVFVNPETNDVWKENDRIRRMKLANTLEIIAEEGVDTMYTANGTIAKMLVKDIQELDGIITIQDFVNYEAEWKAPITTKLRGDYTVHSVPLPASGMILALILNILNGFEPAKSTDYFHQMIESFKYGYAKRTLLGDLPFNESFIDQFSDMKYADKLRKKVLPHKTFNDFKHYGAEYAMEEDHGTAHISVLAANGDAVSITSTINGIFGSGVRSTSTGIILNDQMDDFSTPGKRNGFGLQPSPANFIKPGKRPLSSMCPVIVLDKDNDAVFVSGSAGGSKITTTVAYVFARHFWMKESLEEAVSAKRLHHQLMPMEAVYESGFNADIIEGLQQKGHKTTQDSPVIGFTALTAISRAKGDIEAVFDPRRFGSIEIN